MGKYMRKANLTTTTTMSESTLGVRTRAKTLATSSPPPHDRCYLQLRSRRLHKPSLLLDPKPQSSRVKQNGKQGTSQLTNHKCNKGTASVNLHSGGNHLECESMERSTRESTPCTFIMDVETTITPGSSTRGLMPGAPNQRQQNVIPTNIPSKHDIDEFFAFTELQQELLFIERYNFDIKNDIPLSGRYEWVKVDQ